MTEPCDVTWMIVYTKRTHRHTHICIYIYNYIYIWYRVYIYIYMRMGNYSKVADISGWWFTTYFIHFFPPIAQRILIETTSNPHRTMIFTGTIPSYSGWWFGTFGLFFHILGMSPSHLNFIFFRRVGWNHQPAFIFPEKYPKYWYCNNQSYITND